MRRARPEICDPGNKTASKRRAPSQQRSRERVKGILGAAAEPITEHGVASLTTRSIAAHAGIAVASLYQYFADKDEVILALVEQDTAEMDDQVARAIGSLEVLSIRSVVETTMRAFVEVYLRRPAFVVIWWRGRTNGAVLDYCRAHNRRIAETLFTLATDHGLFDPDTDATVVELAVEVGDRVFEFAFAENLRGNQRIVDEGIDLVTAYLERHATPAGISGVPQR